MTKVRHFFHKASVKNVLLCIATIAISVFFLFPLFWIIASSLKSDVEIFQIPPTLFPQKVTFEAYMGQLFGKGSVLNFAGNSLFIAICSMTISFLFSVPAAYGIARFRIPGAHIIIMIFLVTQMLPSSLLLTPMFLNFSSIGILNTYIAPILAITTITIPFTMLVLRPMFMACPKAIEEAARIDGCNRFTVFLRIVLPTVTSGLVTVCCFGFVHGWNDLVYSLTFNTSKKLFPMTTYIYNMINAYGVNWNWIMAYGCMLVVPPILIFIFAQKYVISGITGGAVKG
ncbi:MAG: carbohydrate ABC transporter permease [Acetanaerobacterium sp.]